MAASRQSAAIERSSHEKLLERIARRYEQLDEKLRELEARLPQSAERVPVAGRLRKPK